MLGPGPASYDDWIRTALTARAGSCPLTSFLQRPPARSALYRRSFRIRSGPSRPNHVPSFSRRRTFAKSAQPDGVRDGERSAPIDSRGARSAASQRGLAWESPPPAAGGAGHRAAGRRPPRAPAVRQVPRRGPCHRRTAARPGARSAISRGDRRRSPVSARHCGRRTSLNGSRWPCSEGREDGAGLVLEKTQPLMVEPQIRTAACCRTRRCRRSSCGRVRV